MELTTPSATAEGPAETFTGDVVGRDGTTWLEPVTDAQYDAANQG